MKNALSQTVPQGGLYKFAISGRLNSYLDDINEQAENQMEWVGRMNIIRSRAMEIVKAELIFIVQLQRW